MSVLYPPTPEREAATATLLERCADSLREQNPGRHVYGERDHATNHDY